MAGALLLGACTASPFEAAPGPVALVTEEEKTLPCSKINGRMQVRILALRGEDYKSVPTSVAQGTRSALSAIPGNAAAASSESRTAAERAKLDALNALLAEKKCPTYDLDKELAQRPSAPPPEPVKPATTVKR